MKYVKDNKRVWERLKKVLWKMAMGPHVAVGILQDEKHDDVFSMVDLATVHEFGSKDGRIPQRSFIRSTCDEKRQEHLLLIEKLRSAILVGSITIEQALSMLGSVVEKDMVQTINRGIEPELAESTVRRKKSSKPLIDTGRLKGAITHEVRGV